MLAAVHVAQSLAGMISRARLELLVNFVVLRALESVQEDATKALVEVLSNTGNDFFQDFRVCRSSSAMLALESVVLFQELIDRRRSGHLHQFLVLGHFFPVVHEDRLQSIRNEKPHSRTTHKLLFLRPAVSKLSSRGRSLSRDSAGAVAQPEHFQAVRRRDEAT